VAAILRDIEASSQILKTFFEANPKTPLYLADVCTAIGTVERTLRIACEEHVGMGPIGYLTLRRMHMAIVRWYDPSASLTT
jgi:AraC-like DNA-binding protein